MRMSGFLFGVAVGATVMYLLDPRQGQERREVWSERLKKGGEQAKSAVETGRARVQEYRERHNSGDSETAGVSVSANGGSGEE